MVAETVSLGILSLPAVVSQLGLAPYYCHAPDIDMRVDNVG